MKKPSFIRMLGQKIDIVYEPLDEGVCGECHVEKRLIKLDIKLEGKELERTFRHEKMHMAIRLAGLNELMPIELEEAICCLMETVRI